MKTETTSVRAGWWILAGIMILASFLRLWRIDVLTEFLADQGSAGVVILEWAREGRVPLAGPAVSTGQRPGPLYYYLIAPSLMLTGFHPLAPAVFFSGLSIVAVFLLYKLLAGLYDRSIAVAGTLVFATSPLVVTYGRNMWNPTAIPFFIILLLIVLWRLFSGENSRWAAAVGAVCGALIQLHYSNIYTVVISVLLIGYWVWTRQHRSVRLASRALFWFGLGFALMLAPFLVYEYGHGFADIRSLLSLAGSPGDTVLGKRAYIAAAASVLIRLGQFVISDLSDMASLLLVLTAMALAIVSRRRWPVITAVWLGLGAAFLPLYSKNLYDHYIAYLVPLPFVLFASVLWSYRRYIPTAAMFAGATVIAVINISATDVTSAGRSDIARMEEISSYVAHQTEEPFSFTVIPNGRSFSDFHYRFGLAKLGETPSHIARDGYRTLFVVCEEKPCPARDEIAVRRMEAMCFDHHCVGPYPTIDLSDWEFVKQDELRHGVVYTFERSAP